jgi:glycosyltransferase involved in cell wall biosynthesis
MNAVFCKGDAPELLSIVAPAFNEEDGLNEFAHRIAAVMNSANLPFEIVFVNDGSTDQTLAVMQSLQSESNCITVINLSRNFGKEIAMTAGLAHASGDAVVVIDTDLQDPPELIPTMVEGWRQGYDVVYAQRVERHGESWPKKVTARLFYMAVRRMGPTPIPENVGDFRLMTRRVVDALLQIPECHRFMKGLYTWVGYKQKAISYNRDPRYRGETKFNYWKLWNFAIEGITSFTILPLKIATYLGVAVASLAFLYSIIIFLKTLFFGDPVQGFTTIMVTMLLLSGVQLVVMGIMGEYLGRVFDETKRRPLYLVESVLPSPISCQKDVSRGLDTAKTRSVEDPACEITRVVSQFSQGSVSSTH